MFELAFDGGDDFGRTMANVEAADASGEVDVSVAINIVENSAFGFGNVDGRGVGEAARHGIGAAGGKGLRFWARDRGSYSNG
jgi:hypothetical protein